MKSFEQNQTPEGGEGGGPEGKGVGGGGMSQKLTKDDAEKYLNEVEEIFQDQKEKYDIFLEILKDFRGQRTDIDAVIAQVKELLKGHKNLIYGFNIFLPEGYEISLDENERPPKENVEFDSFVNKIKKCFQNDENVYKSFLDILNMYQNEPKDIIDVNNKVGVLFQGHPDLLEEFTRLLPGPTAPLRVPDVVARFEEDDPDQHDIKRDLLQYFSARKKSGRNIEGLASSDDKDTVKSSSIQTTGTFKQCLTFCDKVRERLCNKDDYLAFLECLYSYGKWKIEINDLQNLVTGMLGKYPDLITEFNQILGVLENTESSSDDENESSSSELGDTDEE